MAASAMVNDITRIEDVLGVHDLHVWSITSGLRTMSAHILMADVPISLGADIQGQVNELLAHRYKIAHATLQLECVDCQPDSLFCDIEAIHAHEHA